MGKGSKKEGAKKDAKAGKPKTEEPTQSPAPPPPEAKSLGLNVFEFGTAQQLAHPEAAAPGAKAASGAAPSSGTGGGGGGAVTLVGFCPVSDELEACQWEVLPAAGKEAPRFRIVF